MARHTLIAPCSATTTTPGAAARAPSWAARTPRSWPTRRPSPRSALSPVAPDVQWLDPASSAQSHYRNKAKLVVAGRPGRPTFGILDERGRGVDLRRCGLYEPGLAATFDPLHRFVSDLGIEPYDVPGREGRAEARHRHPLPRRRAPRAVRRALVRVRGPPAGRAARPPRRRCRRRVSSRPTSCPSTRPCSRATPRSRSRRDPAPGAGGRRDPPPRATGVPPDEHTGGRGALPPDSRLGRRRRARAPCGTCTAASAGSRCTSRLRAGGSSGWRPPRRPSPPPAQRRARSRPAQSISSAGDATTVVPDGPRSRPRRRQPAPPRHRPRPRRVAGVGPGRPGRLLELPPRLAGARPRGDAVAARHAGPRLRHVPPDDPPRDRRPPRAPLTSVPRLP